MKVKRVCDNLMIEFDDIDSDPREILEKIKAFRLLFEREPRLMANGHWRRVEHPNMGQLYPATKFEITVSSIGYFCGYGEGAVQVDPTPESFIGVF
ncbi:MAG TPA: hypothetical protein PLM79_16855 [Syntrophobacteraceae bacterium]|nr:hypothetical protein [Syntrophobacteraceae bacterium]